MNEPVIINRACPVECPGNIKDPLRDAAPDLLAALEVLVSHEDCDFSGCCFYGDISKAKAVIARARGESQ